MGAEVEGSAEGVEVEFTSDPEPVEGEGRMTSPEELRMGRSP